jgi:2-keto-4-pentenoate hydratase
MTTPSQEAAAAFLVAARQRRTPGPRLPEALRPADTEGALAIQVRVGSLLALPVGGWKCSVPTAERPAILAPIFASHIVRASPCPLLPIAGKARVEPEIAFVLDRDLPHRATPYAEVEIRAALREARLVLELIGPRYADPGAATFPELLADGIANEGLFVGPVLPDAIDKALEAFPVTVTAGGATLVTREGRHPDGHPLRPLYWLANYLAGTRGTPLRAGDIVTTGSYCGVLDVPFATPLTFAFGGLGTLDVTFVPAA